MNANLNNISHLSWKYANKIKSLTEPLKEKFGITYFARQSVSHEGYWEILGNNPAWLEHSAEKKFYNIDPSLLDPYFYQSGLTVISSDRVADHLKPMAQECLIKYDIDHSLCIHEHTALGSEWYFFGTDPKNHYIVNTYITEIKKIYQYITHFKNEFKSILQKNVDFSIDLKDLKGELFKADKHVVALAKMDFSIKDVLSSLGINISKREKDCLTHLVQGKTIKEIGIALSLSPRTVEEYLNRLKIKTNCKYKRNLISLFRDFV